MPLPRTENATIAWRDVGDRIDDLALEHSFVFCGCVLCLIVAAAALFCLVVWLFTRHWVAGLEVLAPFVIAGPVRALSIAWRELTK